MISSIFERDFFICMKKVLIRTRGISHASGIYIIRSKINGKEYVGSTIDFMNRRQEHFRNLNRKYHTNQHLQRHYNKHGKNSLIFGIVEIITKRNDETLANYKKRLLDQEQYYIDTLKPKFNICKFADSIMLGRCHTTAAKLKDSKSHKGKHTWIVVKHHTQETKDLLNLILSGRTRTEEQKQHMRHPHKGSPHKTHKPRIYTEQSRKKQSDTMKKKWALVIRPYKYKKIFVIHRKPSL
jgi:group I intron endonuclease